MARETDGDSQFIPARDHPNDKQIRTMIALAVSETVCVTMSNHYYKFSGNIHRQREGGSIGTCTIGEISRNMMGQWDSKFLKFPTEITEIKQLLYVNTKNREH